MNKRQHAHITSRRWAFYVSGLENSQLRQKWVIIPFILPPFPRKKFIWTPPEVVTATWTDFLGFDKLIGGEYVSLQIAKVFVTVPSAVTETAALITGKASNELKVAGILFETVKKLGAVTIMDTIYNNVPWNQWIRSGAEIAAQITAAALSDGASLAAISSKILHRLESRGQWRKVVHKVSHSC